jgi:cytochrome c oxidase assembly factor CtaG
MKTLLTNRFAGRWSGRSAAGLGLSALGLLTLVFAFLSGLPGGSLTTFALEAIAGLLLITVGFVLMVLGADPFADEAVIDPAAAPGPAAPRCAPRAPAQPGR